jgi:CBS domain-containing protein
MQTILRAVLDEKHALAAQGPDAICTTSPDAPLAEAARLMSASNVGCVLVMNNRRLVGIVSEREVLHAFAAGRPEAGQAKVASVMPTELVTVPPSLSVEAALRICTNRRVRHLPVVDGTELLGLLSIGDLVKFVVQDKENTISELMDYIHGP